MAQEKRWNIAPVSPAAAELATRLKTSPLVAQMLVNRGLSSAEECQQFLLPNLKHLHDPSAIPNLPRAAERIARAIRDGQKIVIYGDYDVDGITATAILWHAIRLLGGQVESYIPHRLDEGYGLNAEAVAQICDGGAKLIVSVDCGVTAIEEAKVAADRGVDLIITDHHEWRGAEGSGFGVQGSGESDEEKADRNVRPTKNGRPTGDEERGTDGAMGRSGDRENAPAGDPEIANRQSKIENPSAVYGSVETADRNVRPTGEKAEPPIANCKLQIANPPALLPQCYALVHPRLPTESGNPYPNPHLCGAGVAFKLAWGIGQAHGGAMRVSQAFREYLVEATALAALGTIADVVPLTGENRVLAHFGLGGLKRSGLLGIQALIESAGLTGQKLDSYHVGFLLAPRLNACGRMGHAREAVEMLTSADAAKAAAIAAYLEEQNKARQTIERKILDEAMEQVAKLGFDSPDCRGVVLGAEGWHPGVIGIVASRIVGKLNKPTVMVAMSNGHGMGSARSIAGFHLAKALDACREHLEGCGGHEMAAGLRLETARFEAFREAFCSYAAQNVSEEMLLPQLRLDAVADLRQISEALVQDLQRMGPFGMANPRPLLCCRGVELAAAPRRVGRNGEHVQMTVRQGGVSMKCIAFGQGHLADELRAGAKIDLAAEAGINEYNGYRSVQLEVKAVRTAE